MDIKYYLFYNIDKIRDTNAHTNKGEKTMKITDGKRTVEITIQRWNGSAYEPDWSYDYFDAGSLPYDEVKGAHIVPDVQYCIDMANGTDEEGARCRYDEYGDVVPDEDMFVFVDEL